MANPEQSCLYWDASAVLSCYIEDVHTLKARRVFSRAVANLLSSLGVAEVLAVLRRLARAGTALKRNEFLAHIADGAWQLTNLVPTVATCASLSERYLLRGADLWHLCLAADLRQELPELQLITFDLQLERAGVREGLC